MQTKFLTYKDIKVANKSVVVRVDYNVPLINGVVQNDFRLKQSIDGIKYLLSQGAQVKLVSHMGRPVVNEANDQFSLLPIKPLIENMLGREIVFSTKIKPIDASVVLYENIRFHPGETANNLDFARELAVLGQIFMLDAFGSAHRNHASIVGITKFIGEAVAGPLVLKEIQALDNVLTQDFDNALAIIGGAKISTKIKILERLCKKIGHIFIGGKMANTLLYAMGKNIGASSIEADMLGLARDILQSPAQIILPEDCVVAGGEIKSLDELTESDIIYDIGPQSLATINYQINQVSTILWNGPVGMFEKEPFANGTREVAKLIAKAKKYSVIGGGDTINAVDKFNKQSNYSFVSTGGGAFLKYLEEGTLIGLEGLTRV